MRRIQLALLLALLLVLASVGLASAQLPAYQTPFITAITYQNVGTATATVTFSFYPEANGSPVNVTRPLNAGAGSSLNVGQLTGNEALPAAFLGSSVMSSNQPVVATLVQLPQSTTVKNRPLSNGFSKTSSNVLLATLLKNKFNTHSKFSIQNADSTGVDVTVKIFNADSPSDPAIQLPAVTLPAGSAKYFDMATIPQVSAGTFNGSATVTAVKSGSANPGNIVGSVVELSTNSTGAAAFEGVSAGSATVFMATGLCNVFGGQTTAYAIQNVDATVATVKVKFAPGTGDADGGEKEVPINPGAKASVNACDSVNQGYSGAATITSDKNIVVIGKVFGGGLGTAFLGEPLGSAKLALPYVRWTNDAAYNAGNGQRVNIAIQNVDGAAVNNVVVKYLDKNGTVVGTHTIATIAAGAKANSNPVTATGDAAKLLEFGTPAANPGGGFGGAVIVEGPAGSKLVAIARVGSKVGAATVAEDYNGIAVQ